MPTSQARSGTRVCGGCCHAASSASWARSSASSRDNSRRARRCSHALSASRAESEGRGGVMAQQRCPRGAPMPQRSKKMCEPRCAPCGRRPVAAFASCTWCRARSIGGRDFGTPRLGVGWRRGLGAQGRPLRPCRAPSWLLRELDRVGDERRPARRREVRRDAAFLGQFEATDLDPFAGLAAERLAVELWLLRPDCDLGP